MIFTRQLYCCAAVFLCDKFASISICISAEILYLCEFLWETFANVDRGVETWYNRCTVLNFGKFGWKDSYIKCCVGKSPHTWINIIGRARYA